MLRNDNQGYFHFRCYILNEVLSLNAQEFRAIRGVTFCLRILNEVLSLNAQEWSVPLRQLSIYHSSMKS